MERHPQIDRKREERLLWCNMNSIHYCLSSFPVDSNVVCPHYRQLAVGTFDF